MTSPACYLCGRRTQRFLNKFAMQETYICRVCENGLQSKRRRDSFPGQPDYGFSGRDIDRLPHHRREKLLIYSNEVLTEKYEDEVLALEEAWG